MTCAVRMIGLSWTASAGAFKSSLLFGRLRSLCKLRPCQVTAFSIGQVRCCSGNGGPRNNFTNLEEDESLQRIAERGEIDTAEDSCIRTNVEGQKKDKRFLGTVAKIKSRSRRDRLGRTFLRGSKLISEALRTGTAVKELFFHDEDHLRSLPVQLLAGKTGVQILQISKESFELGLGTVSSPDDDLLAIIEIPSSKSTDEPATDSSSLPITVICDNVRDPANMGMIIQSSVVARCDRILTTKGCVDVWDPKVLQTADGAHFRASFLTGLEWKSVLDVLPTDSCVYLADSSASLNDAGLSENGFLHGRPNAGLTDATACSYKDSVRDYDSVDYRNGRSIILVIGGETEGVSREALDLCRRFSRPGCRVHIPMMPGVDSLNSAVAGSIILSEIVRQLKQYNESR